MSDEAARLSAWAQRELLAGVRLTRSDFHALSEPERQAFEDAGRYLLQAQAVLIARELAPLLAQASTPPDPNAEELARIHAALDAAHGQALASVGHS